jgi:hypothetical protein
MCSDRIPLKVIFGRAPNSLPSNLFSGPPSNLFTYTISSNLPTHTMQPINNHLLFSATLAHARARARSIGQ